MKPMFFGVVFVIPFLVVLGLVAGGAWIWLTPLVVFGVVPLAELVLPSSVDNPSAAEAADRLEDWRYDAILYGAVAVHFGVVGLFLVTVASGGVQEPIPNLALSNTLRSALVGWNKTLARAKDWNTEDA